MGFFDWFKKKETSSVSAVSGRPTTSRPVPPTLRPAPPSAMRSTSLRPATTTLNNVVAKRIRDLPSATRKAFTIRALDQLRTRNPTKYREFYRRYGSCDVVYYNNYNDNTLLELYLIENYMNLVEATSRDLYNAGYLTETQYFNPAVEVSAPPAEPAIRYEIVPEVTPAYQVESAPTVTPAYQVESAPAVTPSYRVDDTPSYTPSYRSEDTSSRSSSYDDSSSRSSSYDNSSSSDSSSSSSDSDSSSSYD